MATQLDVYWGIQGFHTEARMWLERGLTAAPSDAPERVGALRLDAWYALLQGDLETGVLRLVAAKELVDVTGDEVQAAFITHVQGMAALFLSDEPQARDLFGQALAVFRAHQVTHAELYAAFMHGLATAVSGAVADGTALLKDTINRTIELGEVFWRS